MPQFGRIENTNNVIAAGTQITIKCDKGYEITPDTAVECVTKSDSGSNVYSTGRLPVCAGLLDSGFSSAIVSSSLMKIVARVPLKLNLHRNSKF